MQAVLKKIRPTRLTDRLRGAASAAAITANTITVGVPVLSTGLVRAVLPLNLLDRLALALGETWTGFNATLIDHLLPDIEWKITVPDQLSRDGRYLVSCNHQSWVDTTLMQYFCTRQQLPFTRFFTKWELIFVPIMGLSFKILGFPMMKRHSKEAIAKNPALASQDLVEAKRACEAIQQIPFTLLNYPEGTRYTDAKHQAQQSPYRYLLKPKSGGMALSLQALAAALQGENHQAGCGLLDMTIVYPDGVPTYGDFWMGKTRRIAIDVRKIAVPDWVWYGDYQNDEAFRRQFQDWINQQWQDKDALITRIINEYAATDARLVS